MRKYLIPTLALAAVLTLAPGCAKKYSAERDGKKLGEALCDLADADSADEAKDALADIDEQLGDIADKYTAFTAQDRSAIDENLADLQGHVADGNTALINQDLAVVQRNLDQLRGDVNDTDQAVITIAAVNDPPVITGNTLVIDQGGRAVPVVQVSDVDSPASAIMLSVQDRGAGIDPQHLSLIFERFYRGDPSRTGEGTGLGLAIAKALIEAQHGKLTVTSQLDYGSAFTIHLPAAMALGRDMNMTALELPHKQVVRG